VTTFYPAFRIRYLTFTFYVGLLFKLFPGCDLSFVPPKLLNKVCHANGHNTVSVHGVARYSTKPQK